MMWLIFAIISAFANSIRDIYIKKKCNESPHIIVATTRILAFFYLCLLLPIYKSDLYVNNDNIGSFIIGLAVTVILTAIATVLKIRIIQKESISVTGPLMTLTPIFIIPWAFILLKETPAALSLLGIIISIAGAFLVVKADSTGNRQRVMLKGKASVSIKSISYIVTILMIYGVTTVIDKIEIGMSSAYTYTLIWTGCSAAAGLYSIKVDGYDAFRKFLISYRNSFQALLWTISFFMQQLAVHYSAGISMNTAYIKSISYLGMVFIVIYGGRHFREKAIGKKLIGAAVIIVGNLIIVFGI